MQPSTQQPQGLALDMGNILITQSYISRSDVHQPHDPQGGGGFAGTTFTNQPKGRPSFHLEGYAVHRVN